VTDENGQVTLNLAGQNLVFTFKDEATGSPIPGLSIAVGEDQNQPSIALIAIADDFGQYPFQFVLLEGPSSNGASVAALRKTSQSSDLLEISVKSGEGPVLTSTIPSVTTSVLESQSGSSITVDLTENLRSVLERMSTFSMPDIPTEPVSVKVKNVDVFDMPQQIVMDIAEGASLESQTKGWLLGKVHGIPSLPLPLFNEFINSIGEIVFTRMGATSYDVITVTLGGIYSFKIYKPIFPESLIPEFPQYPEERYTENPLNITSTSQEYVPLSGGYLEVISKDILGYGFVGVLDTQGRADIPVTVGNYTVRVTSSGFSPQTVDTTVSENETSVYTRHDSVISKLILTSDPDLTGFLDIGTPVQFYATAKDANGIDVTCKPVVFVVTNPVGSTVATIDDSGLLIVGPDDGAAKVTARCGGVKSNHILVSGTGEEPETGFPFQGSISGIWFGTCMNYGNSYGVSGEFSVSIDANGIVSGSFSGDDSGPISGSVTGTGDFSATAGSAGEYSWSGNLKRTNSSLSGNGSWTGTPEGASCTGGWSGTGAASS
jgi:hypothetical protein